VATPRRTNVVTTAALLRRQPDVDELSDLFLRDRIWRQHTNAASSRVEKEYARSTDLRVWCSHHTCIQRQRPPGPTIDVIPARPRRDRGFKFRRAECLERETSANDSSVTVHCVLRALLLDYGLVGGLRYITVFYESYCARSYY